MGRPQPSVAQAPPQLLSTDAAAQQMRLTADLQQRLSSAGEREPIRVIVLMQAQANLSNFAAEIASVTVAGVGTAQGKAARQSLRQQMHATLQTTARESQQALLDSLQSPLRLGQASEVRSFWLVNAIALQANPAIIRALAARPDVAHIQLDPWRHWLNDTDTEPAPQPKPIIATLAALTAITPTRTYTDSVFEPEAISLNIPNNDGLYGIKRIRADQVWHGLGFTGEGVVVANIDSGVDWQHPMLHANYRGLRPDGSVDHLHNWFDATTEGATVPYDQNGHGTHTMGTIVGQEGIGVAPGAKWISAKGLTSEGSGFVSWLLAAMQWMYAPGGDTAYAPDIINNSWGSDETGTDYAFEQALTTVRAAGILNVWSNGNNGPAQKTSTWPARLAGSFTVGASDVDDEIAYFSSRGPADDGSIRPIVSAPGVKVESTYAGGGYLRASGTSMAAPHVAGAAALIMQANPALTIGQTIDALSRTAKAISTTVPNNESGYGRIDAYSAVLSVISTGVITGQVLESGQPISGAVVLAYDHERVSEALTDGLGRYEIRAPFGFYTATASAFGFESGLTGPRLVITNTVVPFNFNLTELPSGVVRGKIRNAETGEAITATVTALNTPKSSISDNSCPPCRYSLDLPSGTYVIQARAVGYQVQTQTVTVNNNALIDLDFNLPPTQRIAVMDTGAGYYGSQANYYFDALDSLHLAYDYYRIKHGPADVPTLDQFFNYDTVIWTSPKDSPASVGAGNVISSYMEAGGNVLLSGKAVAFFDGGGVVMRPYFNKFNAAIRAADISSHVISGTYGPLASKVITIAGGDGADNQTQIDSVLLRNADYGSIVGIYPDSFEPQLATGRIGAGTYTSLCTPYHAAFYNFGLEAINNFADRVAVISNTLDAFVAPRAQYGVEVLSQDTLFTRVGIAAPGDIITHVLRVRHTGEAGAAETFTLTLQGNQWPTKISTAQVALQPCESTLVTLTTQIPLTATADSVDQIQVNASSLHANASVTFISKTPAHILLVDDDLFFDVEQSFIDSLRANGNTSLDRFSAYIDPNPPSFLLKSSPPITLMKQYPLVVWFNGYNWFDPIDATDQAVQKQYLDQGGRLLFSSQDALQYTQGNGFDQTYLGVGLIDYGDVISQVAGPPDAGLGRGFGPATLLPFPYRWNLSTAIQPVSNTLVMLRNESGQPAALAHSSVSVRKLWKTAFMPFAVEVLTDTARADLINRAVGWLSPLGQSALTAQATHAHPGEAISLTLRLHLDEAFGSTGAHTVVISLPLASGLSTLTSPLSDSTPSNAGTWRGVLRNGETRTWPLLVRVGDGLPTGTPLTATLQVWIEDQQLHFTRDLALRVGQPILSSSLSIDPAVPTWNSIITATLHITNTGTVDAPLAKLDGIIPTGMTLLNDTVRVTGSGKLLPTTLTNRFVWQGNLPAGAAATLTYQIAVPPLMRDLPATFYHAALLNDGWSDVGQAERWITPYTARYPFPIVMRR